MQKEISGLSKNTAADRLTQYGFNEIKDISKSAPLKILIRLLRCNFILYLLLAGALLSFLVHEEITGLTILLVLFVTACISFLQEYWAEKAIKALQNLLMQVSVVIRDGKEQEIPSRELVPGDIIILRTGEKVPADCVLLEQSDIRLNESVLTGEADDVQKEAARDSKNNQDLNLVFMGSFVVNGKGKALVLHTGMNTRFGQIAGMISETEKSLPLQDKVNTLAKYMVIVAVGVSLITGLLIALTVQNWSMRVVSEIIVLMIALSVSAFPEGLPVVLVMTLALGATRMAKKNAIINRMSIIETLGETTVICSDKTGTITKGEMTVQKIYTNGQFIDIKGTGYEAIGSLHIHDEKVQIHKNETLDLLMQTAVLCNDAKIERTGIDDEYKILGTATEGALLIMAAKTKLFSEDLQTKRISELPFNSSSKMMSVLSEKDGHYLVYAKGAPEVLIKQCKYIQNGKDRIDLTDNEKIKIMKANQQLAGDSYRTVAFAYKKEHTKLKEYNENELTFLGIAGIDDPPREEIAESLQICKNAGIAVKMITGDNKETALAVAKKIGLQGNVLEGEELTAMTDNELAKIIKDVAVFARVKPEHKLRIVNILKQNGEIVAMTGDGVNDAPALKEAHIGIAMGKNGTDVSRSVADLTLKDDNFATIIEAVKEGRTIFNNIRKFVSYQLACNWSELLILLLGVILSPVLGWEIPLLLALQVLFMNLVTDDMPAITLGLNGTSKDIMREKPRSKAKILNKSILTLMAVATVLITAFTLLSFYFSYNILHKDILTARTFALLMLILLEIGNAFNFRSFRRAALSQSPFSNVYLFWASAISIVATVCIIYTPLNILFKTVPLTLFDWILAIDLTLLFMALFDGLKQTKSLIFLRDIN